MSEKITTLDSVARKALVEAMNEALAPVAARFGMEFAYGGGNYDTTSMTLKATFKVTTADGAPADFAQKAKILGLSEDCWGKVIMNRSKRYKIIDIDLRKLKYPVLTEGLDGPGYRFTAELVNRGLADAKRAAS